jgi:repressor LexA
MIAEMQTTLTQRIIFSYEELKKRGLVKNKRAFAEVGGFPQQHWTGYEKGTRRISLDTATALSKHFGLSLPYLLHGEGEMFSDANTGVTPFDVQALGFLGDMPAVELPFVSVKARASFIGMGGVDIKPEQFDTVRLTLLNAEEAERYAGAVVFEVDGDSMEPLMHSGQRVIAWPVPEGKWEQLYNVACVVAYDDTVTIKAIRENDLFTKNLLTLYALDARAGYLPVARQSIRSIWRADEFFDRPKIRL